jgi:hypothetical protein
VSDVIRRDDDLREQIIRPMFGDEWPHERVFPTQTLNDGDAIRLDGVDFTLLDLGPGESPHDSVWLVGDDRRLVFAGDQAYEHMHCYRADGFWEEWLGHLRRLRHELPVDAAHYFGHGEPSEGTPFDWQEGYISTFIAAIQASDWADAGSAKAQVVAQMRRYLPAGDLDFLMELSVEPVAAKLGLLSAEATNGAQAA